MRQGARERGAEMPDHVGVLQRKKIADEGRGIGVSAPQQTQKVLPAALVIARQPERGDEHGGKNFFASQRRRAAAKLGAALELAEKLHALPIHGIEAARKYRLEQLFLGAEMVIDGRKIDPGRSGDQAQAGGLESMLHEQLFGRIENARLGVRRCKLDRIQFFYRGGERHISLSKQTIKLPVDLRSRLF